jgi:hypothetical protein
MGAIHAPRVLKLAGALCRCDIMQLATAHHGSPMKKSLSLLTLCTLAASARLHADAVVVFNEIMYHPATNEPAMEWVELHNQLAVDVDISGWSIGGGIQYTFPSGTVVKGRGFLVVAISPGTLMAGTGLSGVLGPFTGRLGNNGDHLELRNNSGRTMDDVDYEAEGNWPVAPDGSGVSLAKLDRDAASGPARNWIASEQIGGTPGADNFPFFGGTAPSTSVIALDAAWKFDASGTDLGTAWRAPGYNDAAWGTRVGLTNRPIPGVFNTGVSNNGVVLTAGAADPHYVVKAAAQGTVGAPATAMSANGAWLANDAASAWISVTNSGAVNIQPGGYDFLTGFSLNDFFPSRTRLDLRIAADNQVTNVLLNGVPTGLGYVGFALLSGPLTLNSGFVAGTNTVEFRTVNDPPGANPGGFRGVLSATGLTVNANAPLPAGLTTYYFRKSFTVTGNPELLQLRLNALVADGAVFYLNGVEVYRQNMPMGAISSSTSASGDVPSPDVMGPITLPDGVLVSGANVLAVEVHQAAGSADAALFGAELIASPLPLPAIPLAFNEVSSGTNAQFWIELANYGTNALPLEGYVLALDGETNAFYTFSPGASVAAGSYLALTNTTLGFHPVPADKLYLYTPAGDRVLDGVVVKSRLRGRFPNGTGSYLFPNAPTPGAANSFAFHNEIVINEIMYHPHLLPGTNNLAPQESPEQWIELYNRSSNTVDLTGWEMAGGISYIFTPGQTIPSGGFLVVADDVPYLRSLYPSINIVGDYGGRLSAKTDHIVLKDPTGNPADEVRYFDFGHWPIYANGGGSSLELRDPNADNSIAEAWAASDESGKTSWQTYSYRAVANIPSGSGQPTQWQDFILGLHDAGECLIDDLSVIESPTNNPVAIISNGDFESGLSGWRVLGTHNRSRVEPEPGNPGNHVLHLIATGYQEHMHNHIERTLNAGRTISNGREYQISFRARWLAGNNLLNTRLYFNRSARTTTLPVPPLNGTPGAPNSRFVANAGPTFSALQHQPVIPPSGAPVTVSVVAQDPQGVSSNAVWWSANGGTWNTTPMVHRGNGRYEGIIPGQPAGTTVQFYVRAIDGLGAAASFPAGETDSGALYVVEDGQAILSLAHNVRIIMTRSNIDLLHGTAQGVNQTNVMSNDLLPCTIVYDEHRVYYDCGVHLRGSQRGRYSDVRTGFHVNFQPDDLFRGVHPVMLFDRSGAGDATANRQEEIVIKHILNRAGGIPGTYAEISRLIAPRSVHTGPAQFFPRHEDLFIETTFDQGGDGTLFEMELIYYPTTANADGYKNPQPDNVIGTDMTNLGDDKEIYRYNFLIKNNRAADDYRAFVALCKAWSLAGSTLDAQTRQLMDIDEWMRAYALISLCSVGDMYTFGNNHNFFIYQRPSDGKFLYFPWDMDFAFTRGSGGALVGDQNLAKIVNLPPNLRRLYAHMLDIISVSFNTNYMAYWTAHYASLAPGQSYANSLSTIGARVPFVMSTINGAGGNAPFAVTGPSTVTTNNNLVTVVGTAPVQVATIKVNGKDYPITWTTVSGWRLVIPVSEPTNVLEIVGYDVHGNALTNFTRTLTVNYTGGALPDPQGLVVINEIMYNPVAPDSSYIELFNNSPTFSFDLSGWRVNGLDYTFPDGAVLPSRGFLVLAASMPDYAAAYSTNAVMAFDEFSGNLQNSGETLTLLRPGANPDEELIVDRVRYESVPPWKTSPNGGGSSLQLIDASQDNARVSNWGAGLGWQFASRLGNIANGTNIIFWLTTAGNCYIDDISLVGPDGTNILVNGGFESGQIDPWIAGSTYSGSTVVSGVSHSGTRSLFIQGSAPGGSFPNNVVQQVVTSSVVPSNSYTLSYYVLFNTNSVNVNMRALPGNNLTTNVITAPVFSTPGSPNTFAGTLPPYDPLWLNELQPANIAGILDNNGERDPWIELYNAGSTALDLSGYFLANNYDTNLTQWPFPPGSSIAAGQYKVIWADGQPGQTSGTNLHTSFRLGTNAGYVALVRLIEGSPQITDYLTYSNVPPGRSYGDYPDGQPFFRQEFNAVTPRLPNSAAAPPIVAYINEWMAANTQTLLNTNNGNRYDDWFELYNPGNTNVSLDGHYLTDNLFNRLQFAIPPGYSIPANGYLLVWADGKPELNTNTDPALHVSFKLDNGGEQLGLFASDGTQIDAVTFEPQFNDVSQGRFPNGTGPIYFLAAPTPRAPNTTWANRYPVLSPIPDRSASVGELVAFTAMANDPDSPPQALAFSLDAGAPTNAMINAQTGLFTWTPTAGQAPSTNLITVRVTDNGTPALKAAQTFTVTVGLRVTDISHSGGGQVSLTFGTIPGKTYRVEFKNDLNAPTWTPLGGNILANSNSLTVMDNMGSLPQRFYRVVQVD